MRTRWGVLASGAALVMLGMAGCATGPAGSPVPTSTADAGVPTSQTSVPASPVPLAEPDAEAKARALEWIENLSVPPAAERVKESPSDLFAGIGTFWLCQPTAVEDAYWKIEGETLATTTNWMFAHPSPGLITSPHSTMSQNSEDILTSFGQTPQENDPFQGVFIAVAKTAEGTAIHAQAGTYPSSAVCPTPEPGTSFGGIGQG